MKSAYARIVELAEGRAPWAIPWPCVHEFLAIVTHPRIYSPPTPLKKAIDQVEAWLESPTLVLLSESADYWPLLRSTLQNGRVSGPQIHDARDSGGMSAARSERVVDSRQGLWPLSRSDGSQSAGWLNSTGPTPSRLSSVSQLFPDHRSLSSTCLRLSESLPRRVSFYDSPLDIGHFTLFFTAWGWSRPGCLLCRPFPRA